MEQRKKIYRSEKNRMIAGVCGGLADYFSVDPSLMRLFFILLTLVGGLGIVFYVLLWILAPRESSIELPPKDAVKQNVDEIKSKATESGQKIKDYVSGQKDKPEDNGKSNN